MHFLLVYIKNCLFTNNKPTPLTRQMRVYYISIACLKTHKQQSGRNGILIPSANNHE